tara:strand:- start:785 stop:976 length:192 start_codon:yes stop_codon:yes gene_type:complete
LTPLAAFCVIAPFLGTSVLMGGIWLLEWMGIADVPFEMKLFIAPVLFVVWSFVALDLWRRHRS